jgi:hypothetical protein
VAETRPEQFDRALADGKVSTNVYLRRIHNHALGMEWLLKSVIPRLRWPRPVFKQKRAITSAEHAARVKAACVAEDGNDWRNEALLPLDFDGQRLRKVLDELKTKLRQTGPDAAALIPLLPEKGRFTLDLAPAAITLKD